MNDVNEENQGLTTSINSQLSSQIAHQLIEIEELKQSNITMKEKYDQQSNELQQLQQENIALKKETVKMKEKRDQQSKKLRESEESNAKTLQLLEEFEQMIPKDDHAQKVLDTMETITHQWMIMNRIMIAFLVVVFAMLVAVINHLILPLL